MKKLVNNVLAHLGLELRRKPDPTLPKLHEMVIDGNRHQFWLVNPFTKSWWDKPEIEMDGELSELKRITKTGDNVLEIGSHHGMVTLLLSGWVGDSGDVHAIEAEPSNALTLAANCFCNHLNNVKISNVAIGKSEGVVQFGGESLAAASGIVREIAMVTADQFCHRENTGKIDLLKIDVEGFETEVLAGAPELLREKPKLALELHVDMLRDLGSSAEATWTLLQDSGILEGRSITAVRRPDWNTILPIGGFDDIPKSGVVNLFVS